MFLFFFYLSSSLRGWRKKPDWIYSVLTLFLLYFLLSDSFIFFSTDYFLDTLKFCIISRSMCWLLQVYFCQFSFFFLLHFSFFLSSVYWTHMFIELENTKVFHCSLSVLISIFCCNENWIYVYYASQIRPMSSTLPHILYTLHILDGLMIKYSMLKNGSNCYWI